MKSLLKFSTLLLALVIIPVSMVHAEDADIKALRTALQERLPNAADASIKTTPLPGLYEVMAGSQVMYMTKDARYIIDGEENMLVYTPKGDVKHTITVFTDIYCPYCQRLHQEMDDYMENGVKVRYIFVPFKGPKSVNTSVSVWCAKDRNKAMDMAKAGETVESKSCENPISKHQALATELGIRGTPAIMLESGKLMPGYVPSAKLIAQMNKAL